VYVRVQARFERTRKLHNACADDDALIGGTMHRFSLAIATAVAGLAFAAPSAVAEAPFVGPNCRGFVVSDAVIGIGAREAAARLGLSVQEAQDLITAACENAQANSTPPRCEVGQGNSAQQALERGDLDKYIFHLGALANCFIGESPGPPL
jgi:hypothetical protein